MVKKSFRNIGTEAASKFISTGEKIFENQDVEEKIINDKSLLLNATNVNTNTQKNKSSELANNISNKIKPLAPLSDNIDPKQRNEAQASNLSTQSNAGKLWKDKFRTTTVLEDDVKEYLDIIIRLDGTSITQYINNLVHNDMINRAEEYDVASRLFKKRK